MLFRKLIVPAVCSIALVGAACTDSLKTPAEPTAPGGSTGATLKVTAPALKDPINDARVASLPPVFNASDATFTSGTATPLQYRFEVLKTDGTTLVEQSSLKNSTSWQMAEQLADNTRYTWRVRAETSAGFGPWSTLGSFLTPVSSAVINDPLTNGTTKATTVRGGTFIPGQGWQSSSVGDGLDYEVGSCISCTVEFDVTNFGKMEGEPFQKDLKWISMGDAGAWTTAGQVFRDHPWKMHLEQRADFPAGMKLIWRNGDVGDGEPGDHTAKFNDGGPNWVSSQVYHFRLQWDPSGFTIQVDGVTYFQDGFGGHAFAPPNLLIELGCFPRQESFVGAIFRNFKLTAQ